MRRLGLLAFTILALNMLGGEALAGPEWCDDGSPPPNDFRLRPTGVPSAGSSTAWLGSTTGGVLILSLDINTLTGGVAHGMTTALEHARPYATLPSASK